MVIRQLLRISIFISLFMFGTAASAVESEDVHTQIVIIALRHTIPLEERSDIARSVDSRRMQIRQLQDAFLEETAFDPATLTRMQTMPVMIATVTDAELAQLRDNSRVASVQVSRLLSHSAIDSTSQIGAIAIHASGVTGAGTSIAILDTGVDSSHIALRGKIIQEACFSTTASVNGSSSLCDGAASMLVGAGSAKPCDLTIDACGHGTHVAGIAAGHVITQDGITTSGVAPGAKIIAIQVFSRFDARHPAAICGESATDDCIFAYEHDLIRALDWLQAAYNPNTWGTLAAVNMSLGGGSFSDACDTLGGTSEFPFKWYIDQLRLVGVPTIIAAGNEASNDGVAYPGCISSAITVGSVTSAKPEYGLRDLPSTFSNVPQSAKNVPNANGDRLLDLYAPGEWIRSSIAGAGSSSFAEYSGTSMSVPHVTGAWALLKSIIPRADVTQINQLLTDTGTLIVENRTGYDPDLVVPRVDVARAVSVIRQQSAPVSVSTWAIDMGDVQPGQAVSDRVVIQYRDVPTAVRWTMQGNGRNFRMQTIACDGFVDDLTPTCSFAVVFTPIGIPPGQTANAVIRLQLGRQMHVIGVTGRSVAALTEAAMTQTAVANITAQALLTHTATRTIRPTPSSHVPARTVIAVATRQQRRLNQSAMTVTSQAQSFAMTATHVVSLGEATYTPSATPTATRTRTAIPITRTIVHARTATRRMALRETAYAQYLATRTQRAKTTATAVAWALEQTATQMRASGLTFTPTKRTKQSRTPTMTPAQTVTRSITVTRTPTLEYMHTDGVRLYKRHQGMAVSQMGASAVMLYQGDPAKSIAPEMILLNLTTRNPTNTLKLPGLDATALTAVVNRPDQFVVAGRLNWDSLYIQIYDVRANSFNLRMTHIYPLATGARISALYATDMSIFVSIATPTTPAKSLNGQMLVFERSATQLTILPGMPLPLAGVPNVIKGLDDSDAMLVIGGYMQKSGRQNGFVQIVRNQSNKYVSRAVLTSPDPVTDIAALPVLQGLQRINLIFTAQSRGLSVLQLNEVNGAMSPYQPMLQIPATKLDQRADQLAVVGFDMAKRQNVTSVYQWSMNKLQLRRTITHANNDGGIVGVGLHRVSLFFADVNWLRFSR